VNRLPVEPPTAPPPAGVSVAAPRARDRARLGAQIAAITGANAAVAALGFVGSGLLLPHALDLAAFTAMSLFLAAFQFLQEAFGRSLNWAVLRLCPVADTERAGGGGAMLLAARSLQRRLALGGCVAIAAVAVLLRPWLDEPGAPSRAALLALAGGSAALAVLGQFGLGMLQLRQRFLALARWTAAQSGLRLLLWALLFAFGVLDLTTAIGAHLLGAALSTWLLRRATRADIVAVPSDPAQLARDRLRVLRFGGSMALATTVAATAAQIDLFLLDARVDDAATARLRIAVLFATVSELATSAVMTTLLPAAGTAHDAGAQRRGLVRGLGCGAAIALLALLSLPVVAFALPRLLPQYAAAADIYPVLVIGVVATALTDPLGLVFLSRDRPLRFVALNSMLLAVVVLGNVFVPGEDRALVAAGVRSVGRVALGAGIVALLWRDRCAARRAVAIDRHPKAGLPLR